MNCYGIIDRDFRSDYEIDKLNEDGIYTIKVAEVENLFLVEELLGVVNSIMGFTDTTRIDKIKNYIIRDRFAPQVNHQICDAMVSELKYRLSTINIAGINEEEVRQSFTDVYHSIEFEDVKANQEKTFNEAFASNDYARVLAVFNHKSMSKSVGHFFDIKDSEYCDFIIRQLSGSRDNDLKTSFVGYLPPEIPLEG